MVVTEWLTILAIEQTMLMTVELGRIERCGEGTEIDMEWMETTLENLLQRKGTPEMTEGVGEEVEDVAEEGMTSLRILLADLSSQLRSRSTSSVRFAVKTSIITQLVNVVTTRAVGTVFLGRGSNFRMKNVPCVKSRWVNYSSLIISMIHLRPIGT